MTAQTLLPLEFGGAGRTGRVSLKAVADLDIGPGFYVAPCMAGTVFPVPDGEVGFRGTADLAYRVALNRHGLSAGLSIRWCIRNCTGGKFPGLEGGSAGAAFLLALIKLRLGEFNPRTLRRQDSVEEEIAAVRLEWVAASAGIDAQGNFCSVDNDGLLLKLQGLVSEQHKSDVRLAVISVQQTHIGPFALNGIPSLFEFSQGLTRPFPILRVANAEECYRELLRLQAEQVLL